MPIESAEEFVELRRSEEPAEYRRAAHDSAPVTVWRDVIDRSPDMKRWVTHNKRLDPDSLGRAKVSRAHRLSARQADAAPARELA